MYLCEQSSRNGSGHRSRAKHPGLPLQLKLNPFGPLFNPLGVYLKELKKFCSCLMSTLWSKSLHKGTAPTPSSGSELNPETRLLILALPPKPKMRCDKNPLSSCAPQAWNAPPDTSGPWCCTSALGALQCQPPFQGTALQIWESLWLWTWIFQLKSSADLMFKQK